MRSKWLWLAGEVVLAFLLLRTVDARDAAAFGAFLTEDATFLFGNLAPVAGRDAIVAFVEQFFAALDAVSHDVEADWWSGGRRCMHGRASYTRADGYRLEVPFANVLDVSADGRVSCYRVFIDNSALFA